MIRLRQKSVLSNIIQPFFVVLLLCGIFGIIWLRSGIISLEYSISELENKKLDSLKEAKSLLADRASALSMQRVEKRAARQLGLILADRTRVVYVKTVDTGPSRASLDGRRERPYGGLDVSERPGIAQPDGPVRSTDVTVDRYDGGYQ